ncbi:MAG: DUF2314 domain-containing protein [Myxococcales bacterium]
MNNKKSLALWAVIIGVFVGGRWLLDRESAQKDLPAGRAEKVALAPAADSGTESLLEGPILADETRFSFAVYHLARPKVDALALARKLAGERPALQGEGVLAVTAPALADYEPPSLEDLEYFGRGLTDEQSKALQTPHSVTHLQVRTSGANAVAALRELEGLVTEVAKQTGGVVWDEETRLCWSQETWAERLREGWDGQIPVVPKHITVHAYRSGKLVRAITLGMVKFGLPDLVAEDLEARNSEPMGLLLDLTGQILVGNPEIPKGGSLPLDLDSPGGRRVAATVAQTKTEGRKATVSLTKAARDQGDPDNRLALLVFPRREGQGIGEAHAAVIDALFDRPDSMKFVKHDAELEAARVKARQRLFEVLKPRFLKGLPSTEALSVKAPFTTDSGGVEWMWVEIHGWEGTHIRGRLANEPFEVESLKAGAEVSVEEDVVFDYELSRSDGTTEGNETGKIIEARSGPEMKK